MVGTSVTKRGVTVAVTVGKGGTIAGIRVEVAVTGMSETPPHSGIPQAESRISTDAEMMIRNVFMDKTALKWFFPRVRPASLHLRVSGGWRCW